MDKKLFKKMLMELLLELRSKTEDNNYDSGADEPQCSFDDFMSTVYFENENEERLLNK